nr:diacylglycerol kinase [Oceanicoccus sp. KOV_DT_Chl]
MNKPGKTGIARIIAAGGYSAKGLKAAWLHEEAFRVETCLAVVFVPLSFVIADTLAHQLLLIGSCFLVLITELINSAIEAIVDRVSTELHPLSGQAKDIGSSVVFLAMALFLICWCLSCWDYLQGGG